MTALIQNNAASRLASSLTNVATTLSVAAGDGAKYPAPTGTDWFPVTLIKDSGALEIVKCTSRTGDVLTVVRAQEGTAAQAFTAGDRVELRLTAGAYNANNADFTAKTTVLSKGFINGLDMVWVGAQAITLKAGAAHIQSTDSVLNVPADIVLTGIVGSVSSMNHLYLYDNAGTPAVETSTTVPVKYYGTAYSKTGDATRRYLGSFIMSTTTNILGFKHCIKASKITFTEGAQNLSPYLILNGFASAADVEVSTALLAPKETIEELHGMVSNSAGGVLLFSLPEQVRPALPTQCITGVSGQLIPVIAPVSRVPGKLGVLRVFVTSGSTANLQGTGYTFER